jgi:hypothetical protein
MKLLNAGHFWRSSPFCKKMSLVMSFKKYITSIISAPFCICYSALLGMGVASYFLVRLSKGKRIDNKYKSVDIPHSFLLLSVEQVETFKRDGVLVVPSVLTRDEVESCRKGLHSSLERLVHVEVDNLESTGAGLRLLSSTNGSGGVLDIFYESFKLKLAEHPKIFSIITQLWDNTFSSGKLRDFEHPFGQLNCKQGFAYIDRVGFRVPSRLSDLHSTKAGKKRSSLQRSLTPHLDCCPDDLYQSEQGGKKVRKWRPIQCFVALTDTPLPSSGGFEAAKGHHLNFKEWVKNRARNPVKNENSPQRELCLGEFSAMRPQLDQDVIRKMEHIPCCAGDLVLWDNRIPHANSYRNDTSETREVIYLGWLPDIPLNREYVKEQLIRFNKGVPIEDQWREDTSQPNSYCEANTKYTFSLLGEKLMGITPW